VIYSGGRKGRETLEKKKKNKGQRTHQEREFGRKGKESLHTTGDDWVVM